MVGELTAETFAPLVGETLQLRASNGSIEVQLVKVTAGEGSGPGGSSRAPFSLSLLGPVDPSLPQGIYELAHADLEPVPLLIVPSGRDAAGTAYHVVFG